MDQTADESSHWRKCSSCKKPIGFGQTYYVCSVSTCNGQRTGYVFCSVGCFETHLPGARHRDAAAVEMTAPGKSASTAAPARILVRPGATTTSVPGASLNRPSNLPRETLVIASRMKEYIQARAEMNTAAAVMDVMSDYMRILCDRAIENARAEGRKTLLERDFDFLKSLK